jgi:hypothetical protein
MKKKVKNYFPYSSSSSISFYVMPPTFCSRFLLVFVNLFLCVYSIYIYIFFGGGGGNWDLNYGPHFC